jgi:hypothetical protein
VNVKSFIVVLLCRLATTSYRCHSKSHSVHVRFYSGLHGLLHCPCCSFSANDNELIDDEDLNDENSPIKSASYMDELRQRLERVLNDPISLTSTATITPHPLSPTSSLPISKSFRLPVQSTSIPMPSPSTSQRATMASRVPLKASASSFPSATLATSKISPLRAPTLIVPPKIKSNSNSSCLSSTENLRTNVDHHPTPISIGSTPLPRKQMPSLTLPERNLSYRSSHGNQSHTLSYHLSSGVPYTSSMSKSFILPSKRDGKANCNAERCHHSFYHC